MSEQRSTKQDIELAIKILQDAGAREVFIFGSASRGAVRPESDIDMAVRGLPPERFYEVVGRVLSSISRSFDLVDLDEPNEFTAYLERKGELKRVA
jgi:predicted nucleotidyltransferase